MHKRNKEKGITLISTMVALVLLVSLTMLVQSISISNIATLKRLSRSHSESLNMRSARELARPEIAEFFIEQDSRQEKKNVVFSFGSQSIIVEISRMRSNNAQLQFSQTQSLRPSN